MVIARDRLQARIVLRYVRAMLQVPLLHQKIERETASSFDLSNSVTIEIHTANFKSPRGYAIAGVICDEISYWPTDDAADPDTEVINALRPAMSQFPNALLIGASSPYAKRGVRGTRIVSISAKTARCWFGRLQLER
jgi:phage terminase large subunit-like protein